MEEETATISTEVVYRPDYWGNQAELVENLFSYAVDILQTLIGLSYRTEDKSGDAVVCCKRFYFLEDGRINEPWNYLVQCQGLNSRLSEVYPYSKNILPGFVLFVLGTL